ncbi:tRNA epoxyqueuosine(34) reductase QueG [uncultured Rikenella sp.]|uniref:tRNA epoxyqueuosine(34) reductase QueG n=1 Tax=uncultured Rikenella sp. TaxID=368003 RepID=UPI002606B938|nr:tRNA epoxyqueuosine(34) reductase QueG [uncultured Rikenella sp.]
MITVGLHEIIEREYRACGFSAAGTVAFVPLEEERQRFAGWMAKGYGADMGYLGRSAEYRHDLRRLFPGVKSVAVTLTSYRRPPEIRQPEGVPRIARFAWGNDYHDILKRNLRRLLEAIRSYDGFGDVQGRPVVDSAPAFERAWGVRAGLGWIGRSSMLVSPALGSFTLIGLLLLDAPLPDGFVAPEPVPDGCGNCRRCMEACPTRAIVSPHVVNAGRCISYQTIERRGTVEEAIRPVLDGRIFGCDRCMEVCPYNDRPGLPTMPANAGLEAVADRMNITAEEWRKMAPADFAERFAGSPLLRAGLSKIKGLL